MSFAFLSDEWIAAAREIRSRHTSTPTGLAGEARINLVITDVPFGEGSLDSHMALAEGHLDLEVGHLDGPDCTVTTDYTTARMLLVEQDPAAMMQAFMSGRIKVQGDMMKLMAMQATLQPTGEAEEAAQAVAAEIRQITALD